MADRSVVIRLIANVGQYVAGMRSAGAATAAMARQSQTGAAAASASFARAGGNVDKLAKGMAVGGAAFAVGIGLAAKASADFDEKMAVVKANVHSTPAEFTKLTAAVKTQGTQFGFSAMQSADAADDLAKAGLSASQIIGGGLTGALTLAAAGNISAGDAAETAATAMSMFALKSKDIPHIADLLAAGADKSTASVSSLSEGLMEGGSLAHLMGVSIEDTTAVLAEFDQSGLKGAKAGNALKTMFQNLLDPTEKQQKTMDDLNLSFFDANGKFIGLSGVAGQLQDKMGGLDDKSRNAALSILFGARSIQAANILYKDGAKGVEDWQKKVNDSGFAAKNAAAKLDSLKGDLNKLKSAAIELAINGGAAATKFLRPLAKGATDLASNIAHLPGPVLTAGAAFLALSSGGLLAAAATIKVVGAVQKIRTQYLAAKGAVATYTAAQVTARAAAVATADAQVLAAGAARGATAAQVASASAITAQSARFTSAGTAIITSASGMRFNVGRAGAAIALMGRRAPTIAAMQGAYLQAAAGASRFGRSAGIASAAAAGAGGGLKTLAKSLGVVALAYGSVKIREWMDNIGRGKPTIDGLSSSLQKLGESGKVSGDLANMFREQGSAVRELGIPFGPTTEKVVSLDDVMKRFAKTANDTVNEGFTHKLGNFLNSGQFNKNADNFKKQAKSIDDALANLVKSGHVDEAKAAFKKLTAGIKDPKVLKAVTDAMPKYADALGNVAKKAKEVPSPTKAAAEAIGLMGNKSAKSKEDVEALTSAIKGLGDAQLGARGSARGYQAAIDDATASLKENGKTLDITTEKGRNNQEKLDGIASATTEWASSQFGLTHSMKQTNAILDTGKSKYIATAVAMGMNKDKAKALADQLFKLPKSVDTSVDVDGVDGAIYKVDKLGNLVISVSGKKVTIPVSTPNAESVAKVIYGIKDAVLSTNGKSVKIPTEAIDSPETLRNLQGIKGARLNADGSVSIPTAALNAKQTTDLLSHLGRVAVDADNKSVIIPASTPNAKGVIGLISQIRGAQIRTNGKKVVITSSAPFAESVRSKIDKIRGAQVTADGKRVTINSSVPGYSSTLREIQNILAAAQSKSMTIRINRIFSTTGKAFPTGGSFFAKGGITGHGVKRMAGGGVQRPAMASSRPILWGEAGPEAYIPLSKDARQPRNEQLTRAVADYYGYDLVKRAVGGIDGVRAGWDRARPAGSSSQTVRVQTEISEASMARLEAIAMQSQVPVDVAVYTNDYEIARATARGNRRRGAGRI